MLVSMELYITVLQAWRIELRIFGVAVLFCMYFLNHRSEDIETLYMGADKPTLRSYIKMFTVSCHFTLSGSLPTSF